MSTRNKTGKCGKLSTTVETSRSSSHPYTLIDRCRPLCKPEFAVFDAIREAIPVVDAAIEKIVRLIGSFRVECDSERAEKALSAFLKAVPTGAYSRGIDSFIGSYLDSLLMYGTAVGEEVVSDKSGRLVALYNASLKNIEIKQGDNPFRYTVYVNGESGQKIAVKHPERILITASHPSADCPSGRSILEGLPFVTSVLLKIFNSIGTNFERVGNLRYAVTYKPSDSVDSAFGSDRAAEIAKEWSSAMSSKDGVSDFIAVGDVDIRVIGADNQVLDTEIPARQMLEQIVAKTGIPPFMLGLSWTSTERMSQQQSDILTSELQYYRDLLDPVINKICRKWLLDNGYTDSVNIVWNEISLQDEVELAKARLYNAEADKLKAGEVNKK